MIYFSKYPINPIKNRFVEDIRGQKVNTKNAKYQEKGALSLLKDMSANCSKSLTFILLLEFKQAQFLCWPFSILLLQKFTQQFLVLTKSSQLVSNGRHIQLGSLTQLNLYGGEHCPQKH
ncbi:hypothetical protein TTHERM_000277339 (macronuclear) [Tetrahymena thermophila SB210]|uniref:Uncharacterized protein n=1 Tax=Tetrahymena thermophila (strain SB210) TaxID=312017 RepID=W7XBQ8_TETTS|nr:hypothetical protein TTHERM_000277339 [Tetrahymena thermophila SB210]EWS73843.1 hypothetical protein TTHERM_000277339 [Tetrahymena thermophila SB210]|eukprot:XP_012653590.1 hypothetical protein TTHERM_000277339 [Tetrahymena thermophila SB210]